VVELLPVERLPIFVMILISNTVIYLPL